MRYGPRAEWWERPVRDARDAPDFNAEMILAAHKRLKETWERGKWIREVGPYFTPCPRKMWYTFNSKTKENSNMETKKEYSSNAAVKTLQIQLERAEANLKHEQEVLDRSKDVAERQNNYVKERQELVDRDDKIVREIKAALKKLGK